MTTQTTKEETMRMMEDAADLAHEEIDGPDVDAFKTVGKWLEKHYHKAGYKRLGRIIRDFKDVR
jgi:hypothetical protein